MFDEFGFNLHLFANKDVNFFVVDCMRKVIGCARLVEWESEAQVDGVFTTYAIFFGIEAMVGKEFHAFD
jgi:hypothetical protein